MVVIFIVVIIWVFIHYYRKTDNYERSKYYGKFIGKKSAWYPNHKQVPRPEDWEFDMIRDKYKKNTFVDDVLLPNLTMQDYRSGIFVYTDRIEIGKLTEYSYGKKFLFKDYNSSNLDLKGCWELAFYIGDCLPMCTQYGVRSAWKTTGCAGQTYYYETPGGHLGIGDTSSFDDKRVGYETYTR